MSRRALMALAVTVLLVGACSAAAIETTTTSTLPTTTTTLPTTTTTAPVTVEGAPDDLTDLVEAFYDYAAVRSDEAPSAAEQIVDSITPDDEYETPRLGVASVGTFLEQQVATVEMEDDLFLAVDDGSGWRIVGGEWPSISTPGYFGPTPRLLVAIGSDARPGENISRKLGDSIHLIGLDGEGGGGLIGIPRDSMVARPGGGQGKINGVLSTYGPDTFMETLGSLTQLPLEGYVLTGFTGFQVMLGEVLGGVQVEVPFAIHDSHAGASFEPGDQYLNGPDALAFSRARKSVPGGDFTRSEHQGLVLLAAAKLVASRGYGAIPPLMEMSEPSMATNLTPEQLLTFSALAIRSDLETMPNVVAPGRAGASGGASVVFLSASVGELFADLADGRLEPVEG